MKPTVNHPGRRLTLPWGLALCVLISGSAWAKGMGEPPTPPAGFTTTTWGAVCAPLHFAIQTPTLPGAKSDALNQFLALRCYQQNACTQDVTSNCWLAEDGIHFTGERYGAKAGASHAWARGWFSPEVVAWLKANRTGPLDRGMIVKELFTPLDPNTKDVDRTAVAALREPTTFAFQNWVSMLRSSDEAFDGWLWDETFPDAAKPRCDAKWPAQVVDPACGPHWRTGVASGCARCHASAKSHLTFASLEHTALSPTRTTRLAATQVIYDYGEAIAANPTHVTWKIWRDAVARARKQREKALDSGRPRRPYERLPSPLGPSETASFVNAFRRWAGVTGPATPEWEPEPLPHRSSDHVAAQRNPANPADEKSTDRFLTSNQCGSCHNGVSQLDGAEQVMKLKDPAIDPDHRYLNISPIGEWSFSLMSLATRDPVFQAQLEWELDHRKRASAPVQDGECVGDGWEGTTHECYRCHGVMGTRQLEIDRPGEKLTHAMVRAKPGTPDAKYGALARDGVSCMACHRITAKNLDAPATNTGRFTAGPRGELYGPFLENIATAPMLQALGIEPKGRKPIRDPSLKPGEDEDIIDNSKLCGTCHNVKLPKLRVGECVKRDTKYVYEQATYLEWQNSQYAREDKCHPGAKDCERLSCQECHMPERSPSGKAFPLLKIASVADSDFPTSTVRATHNYNNVNLFKHEPFARHTLVGLNLFVMEMFRQFPRSLGIDIGHDDPEVIPGMELAQKSVRLLADKAAKVEIGTITRSATGLSVPVTVTNQAGHKFPSGVGFRRAYLEFQVLDQNNQVLWASGRTSPEGVITDRDGTPLVTEFSETRWEPHYTEIRAENQVQIYEARALDSRNKLTSSFLSIWLHAKDNRLLPKGWQWNDPTNYEPAPDPSDPERNRLDEVMPAETPPDGRPGAIADDPDYGSSGAVQTPLCGCDHLTYHVPITAATPLTGATKVVATLYYQALPPHYLRDRLALAAKPHAVETQRLYLLTSHLNTKESDNSPIANWRLKITSGAKALPPSP